MDVAAEPYLIAFWQLSRREPAWATVQAGVWRPSWSWVPTPDSPCNARTVARVHARTDKAGLAGRALDRHRLTEFAHERGDRDRRQQGHTGRGHSRPSHHPAVCQHQGRLPPPHRLGLTPAAPA